MKIDPIRDHGGDLDAAMAKYGGEPGDWIDLSTGINPVPYPVAKIDAESWNRLPDSAAAGRLTDAARLFWTVPDGAEILAAPGASSLIARIPALLTAGSVSIPGPTYNEHAAAFAAQGWQLNPVSGDAMVVVHPNNPDGRCWDDLAATRRLTVIDESFCDVLPERSLMKLSLRPGTLILKSFGKFWGLAGLRLGFAIGDPVLIGKLQDMLGPWPVSGPALSIGTAALSDPDWAAATRIRLTGDAQKLDKLMAAKGASLVGGTTLFRLYRVDNAADWQHRLARAHIWTRIFPYSDTWLRLGLPAADDWPRLIAAP